MSEILNYFKKHYISVIIYSALALITIIASALLLVWAEQTSAEGANIIQTVTVLEETARTEYLVGQKFDTAGVFIAVNGENIAASDEKVTVNADFTTSGNKKVQLTYSDNNADYVAEMEVKVIFVRELYIEKHAVRYFVESDGTISTDGMVIRATVSDKPETDGFTVVEKNEAGYVLNLDKGMYEISCLSSATKNNFYTVSAFCGSLSVTFNFYNTDERSLLVDSSSRIVDFAPASNQNMSLVVTAKSDSYQENCTGKSSGYYVHTDAAGSQTLIPFAYELTDKAQNFKSKNVEESFYFDSAAQGEKYSVTYAGIKFEADAAVWQSAVVNGNIVDDHGFKLVIGSDKRVLHLTYNPPAGETPSKVPTLTLYVSDYDFDVSHGADSGFSQGVYIFTDEDGNSYKLPYIMRVYVWTYVPLSGGLQDVYSPVNVSDYILNDNGDANPIGGGTLHADVRYPKVVDGKLQAVNLSFTATQEEWFGPALGI